jgi:glycerol-3-phosphate dehydrogenase
LLDSSAAAEAAPLVAEILTTELHRDKAWQDDQVEAFRAVAKVYHLRGMKQ